MSTDEESFLQRSQSPGGRSNTRSRSGSPLVEKPDQTNGGVHSRSASASRSHSHTPVVERSPSASPPRRSRSPRHASRSPRRLSRSPRKLSRSPRRNRSRSREDRRRRSKTPESRRKYRSRSRSRSRHRRRKYSRTPSTPPRRRRSRSLRRGRYSPYRRTRYNDGRDNPEPCACLGVFGMSLNTTERDLKRIFGEYGEIESVQLVYDRYTGRSRGFGFVYFETTKEAMRAKEHLRDAVIDGMRVRVDFSVTKGAPTTYRGRSRSRSAESYRRHRSRS